MTDVIVRGCALENAIEKTQIPNLELFACGLIPLDRTEIINSQAFLAMLEELADKYDHVIVDSPPVLPVADARILGALCDVTVLVLRADKSTRRDARRACEMLASVRARVIGMVMNAVPLARSNSPENYTGYDGFSSAGRPPNGRPAHAPPKPSPQLAVARSM
jgi:capsular exopolysaccharide synthesis family protein